LGTKISVPAQRPDIAAQLAESKYEPLLAKIRLLLDSFATVKVEFNQPIEDNRIQYLLRYLSFTCFSQ